jgi:hypothetical protein
VHKKGVCRFLCIGLYRAQTEEEEFPLPFGSEIFIFLGVSKRLENEISKEFLA